MSYSETLELIMLVINRPVFSARTALHQALQNKNYSEAQFCNSVIKHGVSLNLSNDQWFDFFNKIPNILFAHERALMNTLTEQQRKDLNFE